MDEDFTNEMADKAYAEDRDQLQVIIEQMIVEDFGSIDFEHFEIVHRFTQKVVANSYTTGLKRGVETVQFWIKCLAEKI